MTVTFRPTVSGSAQFLSWAAAARPNDMVTYHCGNLSADRVRSHDLHLVAEAVLLLNETGFIAPSQTAHRGSGESFSTYCAQRTRGGRAPRAVMLGQISASEYRALREVRDRLGYPEEVAADYLALLLARGFIEPGESRGWQPSAVGLRMLL